MRGLFLILILAILELSCANPENKSARDKDYLLRQRRIHYTSRDIDARIFFPQEKASNSPEGNASNQIHQPKSKNSDVTEELQKWRQKAEFEGGLSRFYELLKDNIEQAEIEPSAENKEVYIQFTITENGKMEDIHFLKPASSATENAVLSALAKISENNQWHPCEINEIPVSQDMVIHLKMQKSGQPN